MRWLFAIGLIVSAMIAGGCASTCPCDQKSPCDQKNCEQGPKAKATARTDAGYMIAHMDEIEPVKCSCGWSRRAFVTPGNKVATFHMVEINADAKAHYHNTLTEIYYILDTEGDAYMELDGERVPVRQGSAIFIKPGTRHRAVGKMTIINVPVPAYDPQDVHYDKPEVASRH